MLLSPTRTSVRRSKRNLSNLIFGKDGVVNWRKRDKHGRILGKVMIGNQNVNLAQIENGMAWFYRQYSADLEPADRATYDRAEQEARAARRGLWQRANPTPPWEWRHPEQATAKRNTEPMKPVQNSNGRIIGNRNSKIYHRPDCPDYQKVSEKNRMYFSTNAEAERAGFRRAGNCPGN